MTTPWFTADTHFGHANIVKYCKRPFKDLEDMNTKLIANINRIVAPSDLVFFLGDFCFRNSPGGKEGEGASHKADHYQKQLNGIWIFIKGNHDRNNSLKTMIEKIYIRFGGERIALVHNPMHADPTLNINFVGHVHEKWKFKQLSSTCDLINVGVDQWNYQPVSFDTIMKHYRKWKSSQSKQT